MYIRVDKCKKVYKLYLCHSKKIDGHVGKPINKYLCSVDIDRIKGADAEYLGIIMEDEAKKINMNYNKLCVELFGVAENQFPEFAKLVFDKFDELAKL